MSSTTSTSSDIDSTSISSTTQSISASLSVSGNINLNIGKNSSSTSEKTSSSSEEMSSSSVSRDIRVDGKIKGKVNVKGNANVSDSYSQSYSSSQQSFEFGDVSSLTSESVYLEAADEVKFEGREFNKILGMVHSKPWAVMVTVCVFLSLFLTDVAIVFFPPDVDIYVNLFYIFFTFFFTLEWLILICFQPGYFMPNNTFFLVDTLSILSLIIDCIPLSYIGREETKEVSLLGPAIVVARIFRVLRLWRLFRFFGLIDVYNANTHSYPKKIGKGIATGNIMKLSLVLVFSVAAIALLNFDVGAIGPPMSLAMLEDHYDQVGTTDFDFLLETILKYYPNMLKIVINEEVVYEVDFDYALTLRATEIERYVTEDANYADYSIREISVAISSVSLYSLIIITLFFSILVIIINKDAGDKLVFPFEVFLYKATQLSFNLGTYERTDNEFLNPFKFYMSMLVRMRSRAKAWTKGEKKKVVVEEDISLEMSTSDLIVSGEAHVEVNPVVNAEVNAEIDAEIPEVHAEIDAEIPEIHAEIVVGEHSSSSSSSKKKSSSSSSSKKKSSSSSD